MSSSNFNSPLREGFSREYPAIASKLGTNCTPSTGEIGGIAAALADVKEEISVIDAEIAALLGKLRMLQQSRMQVSQYGLDLQALLSPARRMPSDIWALIFTSCRSPAPASVTEAPLVLGRVCRTWRNIVLSTPAAWSCLSLALPGKPTEQDDVRLAHGARQWLERSGRHSVWITFTNKITPIPHPGQWEPILLDRDPSAAIEPYRLWDAVSAHMWRWKRFDCRVTQAWLRWFAKSPFILPTLSSISVLQEYGQHHFPPSPFFAEEPPVTITLSSAPCLERLSVRRVATAFPTTETSDHFLHLSHLNLAEAAPPVHGNIVSIYKLMDLLSHMPALRSVKATLFPSGNSRIHQESILLTSLETLVLCVHYGVFPAIELQCLMSSMHCERLREFVLDASACERMDSRTAEHLSEFFSQAPGLRLATLSYYSCGEDLEISLRGASTLEHLTLVVQDICACDFSAALRHVPLLKHLEVDESMRGPYPQEDISNKVMAMLGSNSSTMLVPLLEQLHMEFNNFTEDRLVEMIEMRLAEKKLRSCLMGSSYRASPLLQLHIDKWMKQGLVVELSASSALSRQQRMLDIMSEEV